jgi:serine/threonine protein phosphatase PrpC
MREDPPVSFFGAFGVFDGIYVHTRAARAHTLIPEDPPVSFFGVFDGHAGREAAEYVRLNLYDNLVAHPLVEKV